MTDLTDPNDNPAPAGPDDELLAELAAVVRQASPAPDELVQAGAASFTWRSIDAELAELSFDSLVGAGGPVLVRGPGDAARMLVFEAEGLQVDVEVAPVEGGGRSLVGQVSLEGPGTVEVRSADGGRVHAPLDDHGRFRAARIGPGPLSLRCTITPEGGPPRTVETAWLVV